MPRYIDAEKIGLRFNGYYDKDDEVFVPLSEVKRAITMTPTADVAEVKHGKWIEIQNGRFECSECHSVWNRRFLHDPHCGAKMDGGTEKWKAEKKF